ncbi:hypothetical protein HDU92_005016 [Lobulomyces angularis]|nr:hypothetical protein HDU92_005016 [Lobulomyces angularis]
MLETQLAFYSLILGLGSGFIMDEEISKNGFFYGYTKWTFSAILTQALGTIGGTGSEVIDTTNRFATSISIILSTGISIVFIDGLVNGTINNTDTIIVIEAKHMVFKKAVTVSSMFIIV